MIQFTRRELVRAWTNATAAARFHQRTNAHRLLLFYAVECGLKAAYLKRKNIDPLDRQTASIFMHDLNRILDKVNANKDLRLPHQLNLSALKSPNTSRNCSVADLNQVWRYGGQLVQPCDHDIELRLEAIQQWILKELQ